MRLPNKIKLASIILWSTIIIVFTVYPVYSTELSLGRTEQSPSGQVLVPIQLNIIEGDNPTCASLELQYNPNLITFQKIKIQNSLIQLNKIIRAREIKPGLVRIIVYGLNKNSLPGGKIAIVYFRPKNLSLLKTTPLKIIGAVGSTGEGTRLPIKSRSGQVNLNCLPLPIDILNNSKVNISLLLFIIANFFVLNYLKGQKAPLSFYSKIPGRRWVDWCTLKTRDRPPPFLTYLPPPLGVSGDLCVKPTKSNPSNPPVKTSSLSRNSILNSITKSLNKLIKFYIFVAFIFSLQWIILPQALSFAATYYVDANTINASDSNPGTISLPFKTIYKARDTIKGTSGNTIYIREGIYFLSEPLVFDDPDKDSGSEGSPNVYMAYNGEDVRIVGGVDLQPEWFKPVTDQNILNRIISETARNTVLEVNLKEHLGDIDYGNFVRRGPWGSPDQMSLELYVDQERMQIARWPNKDDTEPYAYHDGAGFSVSGVINPDSTGLYMAKKGQQYNGLYYYKHVEQAWYMWRSSDGSTCYISDTLGGGIDPDDAFWTTDVYNIKYSMKFLPQGTASGEITVDGNAFYYKEERPALWMGASDIWTQASWNHLWHEDIIQIEHIEADNKIIVLKDIPGYGIIVIVDRPYYVFNLFEEIDVPGEWYLDRETGNLYLYPPESFNNDTEVIISLLDDYLLKLEDVHHIVFKNITFEITRHSLVLMSETSHDNTIDSCVLRNAGMSGILLHGSYNCIERSEIYNVGEHAVNIKGGDRISLTSSHNVVKNCDIHHWGQWIRTNQCGIASPYTAETKTKNCGHIISHNILHDAPHQAIWLLGNNHVIEYNEIYNVCQEVADAGAIYLGYDWGGRGNIIRYNFIHHINTIFTDGHEVIAFYLDDAFSSIHAYGNIIYGVDGMGIANCGGRDNIYQHNLIIKTKYAFMASDRVTAFRDRNFAESLLRKLNMVGYQSAVWQKAYPECAAIPNDLAIINGDGYDSSWWHSEGCVFSGNAGWDNVTFIRERSYNGKDETDYYKEVSNNNDAIKPLFGEDLCWNRELRPELLEVPDVPGFQPIPFKSIGIIDRNNDTQIKEDINKDGSVNIQDVQCCINHISGTQNWGSAADVNKDGKVNEGDVKEIIDIILGE